MAPRARLADLPAPPPGREGWPWTVDSGAGPGAGGDAWPRISIVTPSLNQGEFIEETVRSVLLQGYPSLQYLVIDGGSTDGTVAILEKYAPWIDFWVSERDRGQSEAINKGLSRCDGEWFNWINSDDYLLPGALEALASAARETTRPIVSGVTRNVGSAGLAPQYAARVGDSWPALLFNLGVNQPGSIARMASVRAAGPLREDLGLCMDLDLWIRLALAHGPAPAEQVPQAVAAYRYHAASKTCSGTDVFALEEFRVLTGLASSLGGLPPGFPGTSGKLAPPQGAPAVPSIPTDPGAVEAAYVDRLLVSDSLLYRAIVVSCRKEGDPQAEFLAALALLRPTLARLYPGGRAAQVEARALVHAMEELGRLDGRMARRAVAARPAPATLASLARIALRGKGRGP
jgi:hypothetical protein